jgi:putative ATPase
MRPESLDAYVGQSHLVGRGKPLRAMMERGRIISMILWGPPGSGKTTLARLLAASCAGAFMPLTAVSSGVRDVRGIIEQAREARRREEPPPVLFIDEIHRFNKSQQDALLQAVEQGDVLFIGATTENPSFEVIPPLRSRAKTFVLEPLSASDLDALLAHALRDDPVLSALAVTIDDPALLVTLSGGDARALLNGLEMCVTIAERDGAVAITRDVMETAFQRSFAQYDKGGEEHFNIISAFIKSVRGSDPDAAVYWMARMLSGGEDPLFIARRMIVLASEDIGNAEPNALLLATACFQAVHAIGMPEARIVLSQTAVYLAAAPKSNASYLAIDKAMADVAAQPPLPVPLKLRNAPTAFMKSLGYHARYRYPHSFPGHFIDETYFPDGMTPVAYYRPGTEGRERGIRERLLDLWKRRPRDPAE